MADKHKIKNIYYMLSYAYQTLRETGYSSVASEEFENIHDLFAAILIHGVGSQIKRGLYRDYVTREEDLCGLHGQIRISETIKRQTCIKGRLVCSFSEFTENSYHNQALKSVLLLLLRNGNVKSVNKKTLRKLLLYFAHVSDIHPYEVRWDAMKYHRNNASYRMLIEICRFVVEGLLITEESGTHKLATWLQGEEMHKLFERFVLAYYKKNHQEFSPNATHIEWNIADEVKSEYLPIMQTDIVLKKENRAIIIDTKYYNKNIPLNRHGNAKYEPAHLYQIYSYVKNYDRDNSGNVAGVLLYARTDEEIMPDEDLNIGGSRISLKTLDLNQSWKGITEQLDHICEWLLF